MRDSWYIHAFPQYHFGALNFKGWKPSKLPGFFRFPFLKISSAPGHPRSLMSFKQFRACGHLWIAITEVKLLRSLWTLQTASSDKSFEAMDQNFMPLMAVLKLITSQWRSWFLPGSGFWPLEQTPDDEHTKVPEHATCATGTVHVLHEDSLSTSRGCS